MSHLNLESVGTVVTKDGNTYPVFLDGTVDWENEIPLSEITDEWVENLTTEETVELIKFISRN